MSGDGHLSLCAARDVFVFLFLQRFCFPNAAAENVAKHGTPEDDDDLNETLNLRANLLNAQARPRTAGGSVDGSLGAILDLTSLPH